MVYDDAVRVTIQRNDLFARGEMLVSEQMGWCWMVLSKNIFDTESSPMKSDRNLYAQAIPF